ncbi:hypothetical protein AB0M80_43310 [Amycolatopsis sp. NPDC051045]|uniref:hypothetical protein n=1 Tax=Amycolatopsis sp. NPDC051045 TaxID=3156922 RepID=UPI003415FF6A
MKRGDRAEQYGRTVGDELPDYELAARRGRSSLAAALISRHNQRMDRVGLVSAAVTTRSRIIVNQLFVLESMLRKLRSRNAWMARAEAAPWLRHLHWGVDSLVSAIRLLASGQLIGATQIARSQLERWALNLAHNSGNRRSPGESTVDYYTRLWSGRTFFHVGSPGPDHLRSASAAERMLLPGVLYGAVSEFLHGRGPDAKALLCEPCLLLDQEFIASMDEPAGKILDLIDLCVDRLRACVATAMEEAGYPDREVGGFYRGSFIADPAGAKPFARWGLWPLDPETGLSATIVERLRVNQDRIERVYNGERPDGRLYRDDEISESYFLFKRATVAAKALAAFEDEAKRLSRPVESLHLGDPQTRFVFVAETLGLVGSWSHRRKEVAIALAAASSGFRSAYWLWLEDDDRAMGVLRVVLESLARVKTWIKNENRARKLENKSSTTPRDWLEAAGWRRLHALNLALGELAHTRENSRWGGARDLLVQLLPPEVPPELAPHRGRGFALETVVKLAARLCIEVVAVQSEELKVALADLLESTGTFDDQVDAHLDAWLLRNWDNRNFDLGEGDFVRPGRDDLAETTT